MKGIGLMRDTAFGQVVRLVSGRRFFKYSEEENHELWKSFIDSKKSANLARHGTVEPPEDDDEKEKEDDDQTPREDSDSSSRTHVDGQVNEASGVKVDPEKGRDINLVTWYDENDPENPQNWTVSYPQPTSDTRSFKTNNIRPARKSSSLPSFASSPPPSTLALPSTLLAPQTSWLSLVSAKSPQPSVCVSSWLDMASDL
jgi:hypothetical protein